MDKYVIEFTANEQKLKKTSCDQFASHTVSYVEAHFILGDNWSGFDSVSAVWTNGWETIATVLDSNGICIVPHEVLERRAEVRVNLVGSVAESDVLVERLTSFPVVALDVTKRAYVSGTETAEVTPSQFEQFVANVKAEADRAETARDNAESIKTEVEGLKADTKQIKTDTEAIKSQTAQIKTDTEAIVDGFDDKVDEAKTDISEAKTDALNGIGSAKTDALTDINSAKTQAVDDVADEGTRQVGLVSSEGTSQVSAVRAEGQTQVEAVQTEGETQVNAVRTEGGTQITNIEQRGADVLSRIPYFAPIITDTAEGSIASFTDGADDYPMVSVVAEINPIQEGSGDPSPTNVRPIEGWSGVTVNRAGKNLLPNVKYQENSRAIQLGSNGDFSIILPAGRYTLSFSSNAGSIPYWKKQGGVTQNFNDGLVLTEASAVNIWIRNENGITTADVEWFQLELGSTATAYEPYQGSSKSIDFKDSQGNPITVYGGNMNITDGEGDDGMYHLALTGLENWVESSSYYEYNVSSGSTTLPYARGNAKGSGYCSHFIFGSKISGGDGVFCGTSAQTGKYIIFHKSRINELLGISSLAEFKTYMQTQNANGTPVQVAYWLATPTPIYCEPTEVKSLKGSNNVWSDTGDSNVEYPADTKLYIDKKINALI